VPARCTGYLCSREHSQFLQEQHVPIQQNIVRGTNGRISSESGEAFTTWNEASSLLVNGVREDFPVANAFVEMVENVSQVIDGDSGWVVPNTDSIRVAQILDAIANHP